MTTENTPAPTPISIEELNRALSVRDLTDPSLGHHALQDVADLLERAVAAELDATPLRDPGSRVVPVRDNYDRLRYSRDDVTRSGRYTRYVGDERMLRSHTSARIPGLLDALTHEEGNVLLSVPGMCHRRDVIDRHHVGEPHQHDLWVVRQGGTPLDEADLTRMIGAVVEAILPGAKWRTAPSPHPYTTLGREVLAQHGGTELEVGECGLAHPDVLAGSGMPGGTTALAMGVGLDRLLMLKKGIDDIRLLRSEDPRVEAQMHDLTPYRRVSNHPVARRDLSVVVPDDLDAELLGDRVREAMGERAGELEEVAVLSETPYEELPSSARERMGAAPGQKNVLVRIKVRPAVRTLRAEEANTLRDEVYRALHQGQRGEWTS